MLKDGLVISPGGTGLIPAVAGLTEPFGQIPHGLQNVRQLREEQGVFRAQAVVLLLEGRTATGRIMQLGCERVVLGEDGGEDVVEDVSTFLKPREHTRFVDEHTLHCWLRVRSGGHGGS
jgi:hypothetical protein